MVEDKALAGKVAIVTGSGKNIGRRLRCGWPPTARVSSSMVAATAPSSNRPRRTSGKPAAVRCPTSQMCRRPTRSRRWSKLRSRNSAGWTSPSAMPGLRRQTSFLQMSLEEWHEILSVALDGAFILAKAAVPEMIKRGGGAFIGLSGVSHHAGSTGRVHVNASKAGLEGFLRGLAMELAPHNITANAVAPGSIETVRAPRPAAARPRAVARDPARPPGPGRGDRRNRALSGRPGRPLHHRPDDPRQRRSVLREVANRGAPARALK